MKKTSLSTIAWILLGLLGLSALTISLGTKNTEAFPSVESYAPSGTAAFAELLRQNGYQVVTDRRGLPTFNVDDVVVVFEVVARDDWASPKESAVLKNLGKFVAKGGKAIVLPISKDFRASSQRALAGQETYANRADSKKKRIQSDLEEIYRAQPELEEGATQVPLWNGPSGSVVAVAKSGKGTVVEFGGGLIATNRFIDRADNAEVVLSSIQTVAPKGSRIVFAEGSLANHSPGLLETIGGWAEASWYQLILVIGVVMVSLGKRFGLPDEERPKQRGARELLDAVADTYKRARATKAALKSALKSANSELRDVLKLPRDASDGERNRLLPETLTRALAELEVASKEDRVRVADAFELVTKLEAEMDAFLGDRSRVVSARRRHAA